MMISTHHKGILCMVLAAALFVANDTAMKFVMADLPPFQVLTLRGASAAIWCSIIILVSGQAGQLHYLFNRWVVLRSCCEVLAILSFITALKHMPIAETTAIFQIAPLLVLVGTWAIWGDRIGGIRIGLILLGIAGAIMVAQPGSAAASPYALVGFITAVGSAARDLVGRRVPATVPGLIVAYSTILVVLIAAIVAHLLFETWVPPTPQHFGLMALAGLLLTFAHLLIFLTFRLAPASVVAPFYYTFTIWAVIYGLLVFGDVPNGLAISGMVLIILAGLTIILLDQKKSHPNVMENSGL
jgi:drug/metabolite transporter (DMT)-like permease